MPENFTIHLSISMDPIMDTPTVDAVDTVDTDAEDTVDTPRVYNTHNTTHTTTEQKGKTCYIYSSFPFVH